MFEVKKWHSLQKGVGKFKPKKFIESTARPQFMNFRNDFKFVPSELSLMFVGKAWSLPQKSASLCWAPGLTHKQLTGLERPTKDKHSCNENL